MPDPIWLDTNVVIKALDGEAGVNAQLSTYRKQGRQLLVGKTTARELFEGRFKQVNDATYIWQKNVTAELRKATQDGMEKIGVKIDEEASKVSSQKREAYRNPTTPNKVSSLKAADRMVLADIKAGAEARGIAKPQIITGDGRMLRDSNLWEIDSVPRANPRPGSIPDPPRVDLADYPPEKEGKVSGFFKDRPFLEKLGLIGLNVGAQYVKDKGMQMLWDHFTGAVDSARQQFLANWPDPTQMKRMSNIDRFKQAYEASLSKLNAPDNMKKAEAVALALTNDRDIEKAKRIWDDKISQVQSAADGSLSGFSKVASEYVDAMVKLSTALSKAATGLPDIANDIEERGSILKAKGISLVVLYKKWGIQLSAFPFAYFMWLDVYDLGEQFQNLGTMVLGLAREINDRYDAYDTMLKQLDAELIKVGDEVNRHS